jgi:3'-phosphoadenosine 5'-phosphosulfate sulfotransferase (PAPS reductase)/FAD synthetase
MDRLPIEEYAKVIVAFSGGKDSLACVQKLLEMGIPKEKIELWHHDVDGAPGSRGLMDWPCTRSYVRAVAAALGLELRFSWREGGIEREMLREGTATAPITFEDGERRLVTVGGQGPPGTRLKFPALSASLMTRWCSSTAKIEVGRRIFTNDPRFAQGTYLFVTGERREESPARAKYAEVELHHSSNSRRIIHQWRAAIDWKEEEVWAACQRSRIRPHPAYELGWSRVSCALCIFGDKDQWASARELLPDRFRRVLDYERRFDYTIRKGADVEALADQGSSFLPADRDLWRLATQEEYPEDLALVPAGEEWKLPAGAYRRGGGPS